MGPEWYYRAWEAAEEAHEPEEWDGREWDELTAEEQEACALNQIY